jgi:hypothetical protein
MSVFFRRFVGWNAAAAPGVIAGAAKQIQSLSAAGFWIGSLRPQ